jgi:hypothetical protein
MFRNHHFEVSHIYSVFGHGITLTEASMNSKLSPSQVIGRQDNPLYIWLATGSGFK